MNYFLKVDKDLFKLGLNPTEILLLAQISEFQTNTGVCFMSDKALAENFGVSESTIKRELKKLEELGFITRTTKNIKGGKERVMKVNTDQITKLKLSLVENNKAQNEPCTSVKLSFDKGQNDTIKDNIKDNLKDNIGVDKTASLRSAVIINSTGAPEDEVIEIEGVAAVEMSKSEATDKYGMSACANRVSTPYSSVFWIGGDLIKLK